jgi:hypothetical protein
MRLQSVAALLSLLHSFDCGDFFYGLEHVQSGPASTMNVALITATYLGHQTCEHGSTTVDERDLSRESTSKEYEVDKRDSHTTKALFGYSSMDFNQHVLRWIEV